MQITSDIRVLLTGANGGIGSALARALHSRNERATLRKRVRLAPGSHTFAFRFEGKVGGCNVGAVSGWGGEITVTGRR